MGPISYFKDSPQPRWPIVFCFVPVPATLGGHSVFQNEPLMESDLLEEMMQVNEVVFSAFGPNWVQTVKLYQSLGISRAIRTNMPFLPSPKRVASNE